MNYSQIYLGVFLSACRAKIAVKSVITIATFIINFFVQIMITSISVSKTGTTINFCDHKLLLLVFAKAMLRFSNVNTMLYSIQGQQ